MRKESKSLDELTVIKKESCIEKIFRILAILGIIICPVLLIACFRVVKQYKRAVILRFGRVRRDSPAGPGIIWVIPCTDDVALIDLRTQSLNLPLQEILTKDSVTVSVDAVVYFHVANPIDCLLKVQYHSTSTELLTIAILRNILGQYTLTDALKNRELISLKTRMEVDRVAMQWGVEIERVEIKNILLPHELQKALAAEAEGTRMAKAKIIGAEGEIKAAESLNEAAKVINENPKVMLLRYLQTLNFVASQQQTSIIFPFPVNFPDEQSQGHA